MPDDIVTRLRERYCSHGNNYDGAYQPVEWSTTCERCELDRQAADEIERLRKTAYALIDELRYNGGYEAYTSQMVFAEFYEQAVNDG